MGGTTVYDLCVYSDGALVLDAHLPSQGGWRNVSSGLKYTDRTLANAGIQSALLKSGVAGKTKALVKGKGANLPVPALPPGGLALPVEVQLGNDLGECWESTFPSALANDGAQFKAKF